MHKSLFYLHRIIFHFHVLLLSRCPSFSFWFPAMYLLFFFLSGLPLKLSGSSSAIYKGKIKFFQTKFEQLMNKANNGYRMCSCPLCKLALYLQWKNGNYFVSSNRLKWCTVSLVTLHTQQFACTSKQSARQTVLVWRGNYIKFSRGIQSCCSNDLRHNSHLVAEKV